MAQMRTVSHPFDAHFKLGYTGNSYAVKPVLSETSFRRGAPWPIREERMEIDVRFGCFLDLPADIRSETYSYFTKLPTTEEYGLGVCDLTYPMGAAVGGSGLEGARCHPQDVEVSTLWLPPDRRRYSTIGESKKKWDGYVFEASSVKVQRIITRGTAIDFGDRFLRALPSYKLFNIRYIEYDASICGRYIWHPNLCMAFPYGKQIIRILTPETTNIDFQGLSNLSDVLRQYKDALSSLKEVKLYGVLDGELRHSPILEKDVSDAHMV
ncbi:hypothetical protein A1O7_00692 [Cladophialophora yegresii CBS 114405]|uniref:Uncharacterized protein n=1 Tax=Cladophialophora yegresii CBS 114405 TaxID=1182544 RepID=W9WIE4_9EURO|nr:uncharacterized protein A1O7_00692 [Cladophialophora yegresii CBS 114405]EXJ64356.1 hypothetical protein A1O7_00692 [Cladophialophora yegresii CBS 114405]